MELEQDCNIISLIFEIFRFDSILDLFKEQITKVKNYYDYEYSKDGFDKK